MSKEPRYMEGAIRHTLEELREEKRRREEAEINSSPNDDMPRYMESATRETYNPLATQSQNGGVIEPTITDKVQSGLYGFNKGLAKTVDSAAAAGNVMYGASSYAMGGLSKIAGADELANDFYAQGGQAYSDANKLWNGKVAEQYVEDNMKPPAIDRFKNTQYKHQLENWEAGGGAVASTIEAALGGRVVRIAGDGVRLTTTALLENEAAKKAITQIPEFVKNNISVKWLNDFLKIPLNTKTLGGSAAGGYVGNLARSSSDTERANSPISDFARQSGGYLAGDLTSRGIARGVVMSGKQVLQGVESILKTSLSQEAFEKTAKFSVVRAESLMKSVRVVQENTSNLVNGLVLNISKSSGKDALKAVRGVESAAKDAIKYASDDSRFLAGGDSAFGNWLMGRKGVDLDMEFIGAVSPELASLIKKKGDKKAIYKELVANKDLLNAFTIQKNNDKALQIALYLPEYTLKEKVLKDSKAGVVERLKKNLGDFTDNTKFLSSNEVASSKLSETLGETNNLLTNESNLYKHQYKELLSGNPDNNYRIETGDFKNYLKNFSQYVDSFAGEMTNDANFRYTNNLFKELAEAANTNASINPLALLDIRSNLTKSLESSKVDRFGSKALSIIDEMIVKNADNLPANFEKLYKNSLDFDEKVLASNLSSELIKTLTQGEPTTYISSMMNTADGVKNIRKALSNEKYNKFQRDRAKSDTNISRLGNVDVKISDIFDISVNRAVEKQITSNKAAIDSLSKQSKEVFSTLCNTKLRDLILNDLINFEKSGGRFDFNSFAKRDTILNNQDLIIELMPQVSREKAIDIINSYPIVFNKIGELTRGIDIQGKKGSPDILTKLKNSGAIGSVVGGVTGAFSGTHTGITAGTATGVGLAVGSSIYDTIKTQMYKGAAKGLSSPDTAYKLIRLAQRNKEDVLYKYLFRLAKPTADNNAIPRSLYNSTSDDKNPNNPAKDALKKARSNAWDYLLTKDNYK